MPRACRARCRCSTARPSTTRIRAALALGCTVHETSIFARKNYFYPDLPKGYQISQYEQPLATGGVVALDERLLGADYDIGITRVHMEEDAGKSLHEGFRRFRSHAATSIYNRSGVPLIEIVTEPDLRSAADAAAFFSHLRELLVWLGVNDGNMEEGSLRCDANVSVRPAGATALGTKAEVKNLNSFRFLAEGARVRDRRGRSTSIASGGRVVQETRLWDAAAGRTVSMRSKEEAHDYRYFPEPDLPPLVVDAGADRRDPRRRCPSCRTRGGGGSSTAYGLPESDAVAADAVARPRRLLRGDGRAPAPPPKAASNWMHGRAGARR